MVIRMLIVDDEPTVRSALRRTLPTDLGLVFFEAGDGVEGLRILAAQKEKGEPIQIVSSDFRMPEMDGGKFLPVVAGYYPETFRLLVCDVAEDVAVHLLVIGAAHRFVSKPWNAFDLRVNLRHEFIRRRWK